VNRLERKRPDRQASRSAESVRVGTTSPLSPVRIAVAGLWLLLFCLFFFSLDLPNSQPRLNRAAILENVPWLLLDVLDPPPPEPGDAEGQRLWQNSGWSRLPQRVPLLLVSLIILGGAWGAGHLLWRAFRFPLPLGSLERTVLAMGLGLSALSLMTLLCGLAGLLFRPLFAVVILLFMLGEVTLRLRQQVAPTTDASTETGPSAWSWWLIATLPFLGCILLGALLPEVDFDVKEYHFQGPKEWYLGGQIVFLPHNVYTSFPFLTEMLTLLGMVLYGDWYWGALAGKGVLASFAPLTALGLLAAGRRWFTPAAGLFAAFIHLSTPWIYRISIIAYAEGGLTYYLFATLLAVMLAIDALRDRQDGTSGHTAGPGDSLRLFLLAGLLAGSAMACKYPGLVSVVAPLFMASVLAPFVRVRGSSLSAGTGQPTPDAAMAAAPSDPSQQKRFAFGDREARAIAARIAVLFLAGVSLTVGPWLLKNAVQTGNPVYPLLYDVFGGRDWDAELNARWKAAHSPDHFRITDLGTKLIDVTAKSDWLSPLLYGFAPFVFFAGVLSRRTASLWLYVGFLFLSWWLLTHRIDRFWVPMLPVVSLLAGVGASWNGTMRRGLIAASIAVMIPVSFFNLTLITSRLSGYNAYLLDLNVARTQTAELTAPEIARLNRELPPGAKVLSVGEAEVFDAEFPVIYNTVFDYSIFEQWCGVDDPAVSSAEKPLRDPEAIREAFTAAGITHVLVNWQEILRYRTTYGYTDFVTPARFEKLQELGILSEEFETTGYVPWANLSPAEQQEIQTWAPSLRVTVQGVDAVRTGEVYRLETAGCRRGCLNAVLSSPSDLCHLCPDRSKPTPVSSLQSPAYSPPQLR